MLNTQSTARLLIGVLMVVPVLSQSASAMTQDTQVKEAPKKKKAAAQEDEKTISERLDRIRTQIEESVKRRKKLKARVAAAPENEELKKKLKTSAESIKKLHQLEDVVLESFTPQMRLERITSSLKAARASKQELKAKLKTNPDNEAAQEGLANANERIAKLETLHAKAKETVKEVAEKGEEAVAKAKEKATPDVSGYDIDMELALMDYRRELARAKEDCEEKGTLDQYDEIKKKLTEIHRTRVEKLSKKHGVQEPVKKER